MFLSNKPEGIENDRELFASTMGAYVLGAYEEVFGGNTSTNNPNEATPATPTGTAEERITKYLVDIDNEQGATIKITKKQANVFAKHLVPIFNAIKASGESDTKSLLNQVATRYAQLWANDQALNANKLALT